MKKISLFLLLIVLVITSVYAQSTIEIGDGILTNQSLPMEPYYGYTISQTIYLQEWINNGIVISDIAYYYNGNSAWTEGNIQIWMAHTDLNQFTNTTDWVTQDQLLLVYDGPFTVPATEGWVNIQLDLPFDYNNNQNLLVAFESNTSGYTSSSDEFFCTSTTAKNSLEIYSDGSNYNFINPPGGTLQSSYPNISFIGTITGVSYILPSNNATNISLTPTLSFESLDLYTNYEIYFGDSPNPETLLVPFSPLSNPVTYTFTETLEYYTDYYWTIVLYDANFTPTLLNYSFETRREFDGYGTEESPYIVSTVNDLIRISADDYFWDKHFIQAADIDASATSELNEGAGFSPIGSNNNYFTGSYDGQGYTITNLYINSPSTFYVGLFGYTQAAEISNLGLVNAQIVGASYVGSLVGRCDTSTISNSSATGNVSGDEIVGGLIGYANSTINNCYSTGDITATGNYVGGLTGHSSYSSISSCYASGNISSTYNYVGGLVGACEFSTINQSYAMGLANGYDEIGGLVGSMSNSSINNSYASGGVTSASTYSGGLVGRSYDNSTISKCYASGSVVGMIYSGGLLGHNIGGSVIDSFWDIGSCGQTSSAGGTGKTSLEMKDFNTYINAGWDLIAEASNGSEDIWYIQPNTNSGYPFLLETEADTADLLPNYATLLYPENGDDYLANSGNLSWNTGYFQLATGFKLNLGTDNPPTNIMNNQDLALVTSYEYFNLEANTTYYWQVVPYNQAGDADNSPIWSFTTIPANLLIVGEGFDTSETLPINHAMKRSYSQTIYLQSELNIPNRQIEKIAYYVTDDFNFTGANQWKIFMGHTDKTEFSTTNDWLLPSQGLTQVADLILAESITEGWLEIELDTPFAYNKVDNLVVGVIEYSSGNSVDDLDFYTVDTESNRSLSYGHNTLVLNPFVPYSGELSTSIPKLNFMFNESVTSFSCLVKNNSNNPIPNAIFLMENVTSSQTDESGLFELGDMLAGTYQLTVSAPWYETQNIEFQVIEGEENYLEITLLEELLPANDVVATLAADLSHVNITWSAPALSREASLSKQTKGIASKTKANLVQKQELEERTGQPEVVYNLYRYGAGEENSPENWVQLATNLGALTYADNSFPSLELGSYYWAVEAVYANDRLADPVISNEIVKEAYLGSNILDQIDFGVVYLTNESEYSEIILTNSGTGDLSISDISCTELAFNVLYDESDLVLEANSSLTVQVNFAPENPQVYMAELIIINNSTNEPNFTINLRGVCEYLPPLDPSGVQVLMADATAQISWNAVTEDINQNPITPDLYIVYYNGQNTSSDSDYYFLGYTSELTYNHIGVGLFSEFMFYSVKAYIDVDNEILSQINEMVAQKRKVSQKEIERIMSKK